MKNFNEESLLRLLTGKKTTVTHGYSRYYSFYKEVFVFQKTCFEVRVLKTFKVSKDCHIKTCRSLKRRAFWKSLAPFFRRIYTFSVGFKMKPPIKNLFQCEHKNPLKFCRKTRRKEQSFVFSVIYLQTWYWSLLDPNQRVLTQTKVKDQSSY